MRKYLREIAITLSKFGLPSVKLMERFLSLLIMSRDFKQIFNTTKYTTRDLMWFDGIDQFSKKDRAKRRKMRGHGCVQNAKNTLVDFQRYTARKGAT